MEEYKCEISLPAIIVRTLGLTRDQLGSTLQKELAIHFFEKGEISFGQARKLSGLSVWDFIEILRDNKIPLHYDIGELEEDSETIKELLNQ